VLTGHCQCGEIRYEIAGAPLVAYHCHCGQCRRANGASASTNAIFRTGDLKVVAGAERLAAWESSPGKLRHFCSRCGSPLFSSDERSPKIRSVRIGTLDGAPGVRPTHHIMVGSKAPWTDLHDDLPQHLESLVPQPSIPPAEFAAARRFADTSFGRIAYVERGEGPAALFLHGVPLNGYHWRHQLAGLSDVRRCIAPDLLGLGHTEVAPGADLRFTAQADMLLELLDAKGIDRVDLVGNDSGGGIAQILAARAPERLRSLVLTNCDTHDNWPPAAFMPLVELARAGQLGAVLQAARGNPAAFAPAYERPEERAEAIGVYLEPVLASPERIANLERYVASMDSSQTTGIRPQLEKLEVPTLVVWAMADVYFAPEWADWLARTLPGVRRVARLDNAKLFFPEERPYELNGLLREHWKGA
jgi:pimeloyl-ACP methyl ester carboxylesterase